MSRYPLIRFLQTPGGRFLDRRLSRFKPWKRTIARRVWRELQSDPQFMAELREAEAEFAAGGGIRYEVADGELIRADPLDVIDWHRG